MFKSTICIFIFLLFFALPQSANAQIVINEFSPKNPEWVEFFNQSANEINLESYYFDDDTDFNSDSGTSTKIKLQGILPVNSLCYLDLSTYLNDTGDNPTLFALNGDVLDTYQYASSSASLSYSRIPDGGTWQINTAFSKTTISCQDLYVPTPTPTSTPTIEPTQSPTKTPSPTQPPTSKPTPTKSPSPKPTVLPTEEAAETKLPSNELKLSDVSLVDPSSTPKTQVLGTKTENKKQILALTFIFMGILFLGYGGYLLYNMNQQKNENQFKETERDGSETT